MAKKKPVKYVLFGCWADEDRKFTESGYVCISNGDRFEIWLDPDISKARVYMSGAKSGHGTPRDWAKLLNEVYGLNVHPVRLSDQKH